MINLQKVFSAPTILCFVALVSATRPCLATDTQFWQQSDENNTSIIDHVAWQKLLDRYLVTNHPSGVNRVRYKDFTNDDKQALKAYLSQLQSIDPRQYKRAEQMAYWINLYNALTVDLILENYPVKSIKKIGNKLFSFGPWDDPIAQIAGQELTLNDIEHKILRPIWKDRRIHYAVNCASYGCPNLSAAAYTASNTNGLLEQGATDYINHRRGVSLNNGDLTVSSIYHWYSEDFGGNDAQLLAHLKRYANPNLKQALDDFNGSIDYAYDWSLNDANQ